MTRGYSKPSRRDFLCGMSASVLAMSELAARGAEQPRAPAQMPDSVWSHIRGFNYQPSYAAHGLDIWRRFDATRIEHEISLGKKYFPRINTLRLWLSWDAFLADGREFAANFETMLGILHRHGLRAIVTLFNAWHSIPDFGGVSTGQLMTWKRFRPDIDGPFLRYLQQIVGGHRNDPRVVLWDLCNEPPGGEVYLTWLKWIHENCKSLGAEAPICIGHMPNLGLLKATEPLCDVLTWHPYWAWNTWRKDPEDYLKFLDESVAYALRVGKPLVATECCWGAADDRKRAEVIAFELAELKKRRIGWTAHLLHDTLVADGHRSEWSHTAAGYMAFVEADGTLRPHHHVFNDF